MKKFTESIEDRRKMTYYLTYLKDVLGQNYVGINVPETILEPHLERLKEILGEEDYQIFTQNKKNRDHGHYHITVINVMDYNHLSKEMGVSNFIESLELAFKYPIEDLEMLGVGTASGKGNTTYFVVCQSDSLDAIRTRFNLSKYDFHITIGFNRKDVFGVRKNEVII